MQSFGIVRRNSKADLASGSGSAGAWPTSSTMASRGAAPRPRMPIADAPWSAIIRHHLADYIAVGALAAIAIMTEHATPFIRSMSIYAGPDGRHDEEMWRYSYPLVPRSAQRVQAWVVPVIAFTVPLTTLLLYAGFVGCSRMELHASLLALFGGIFATGAATNTLKISVARPRPNFAARCWPNGAAPQFDARGIAICAADAINPLEGRKSFPSGHTSWTAAGCGFTAWWLAGKLRVWDPAAAGHPWRLVVASIPVAITVFVGVSRLQDSWHHPTDVMAGGALGGGLSYLFYRQAFPCFASARAGEAYAGGGGGGSGGTGGNGGEEGAALVGGGGADLGV